MNKIDDFLLEKEPGTKELIIGFEKPCRFKKKYELWDRNEIEREKKLFSIPSDFILHPLQSPDNPNEFEYPAPFFLTLRKFLNWLSNYSIDNEANKQLFKKYQYSWILQGSKALIDIHSNDFFHGKLSNESFYVNEYLQIGIGNIGYNPEGYSYKIHQYYKPNEGFEPDFNILNLPLINQQQYDVYSFGVLIIEILTLKPFCNLDKRLDKKKYKKYKRLIDDNFNELKEEEPDFEDIIRLCIDEDPNKRIKSNLLFDELQKIIIKKNCQYAIDSLKISKPQLNVFEAMKITPQFFPIEIQIINELNKICTYDDVFQVIRTHPKLLSLFDFSYGSPLIKYDFSEIKFEICYEKGSFVTTSSNEYLKDYKFDCLFTMTLKELLFDFNFVPSETDVFAWFLTIQYYILLFIQEKIPVHRLSLDSIFVSFDLDKTKLFLFPIGEDISNEEHNIIGWLTQFGKIMNEIVINFMEKMDTYMPNYITKKSIPNITTVEQINDIQSIQSIVNECLTIDDPHKVIKITNTLFKVNEANNEMIEISRKDESLNIFSIFKRITFYSSLPEGDRFKDCTKDELDILYNLLYSFLDYFLPEQSKFQDMESAILPFNILRSFYDVLYNYKLQPLASKVIAEIDESIKEMKRLSPIIHEFDLTGLQFHLFRQFMITTVPKILIGNNNHELVITVNDDDSDSNILVTIQKVIDFAKESDIEYEKIDDNTVSLHYYTY